MLVVFLKIIAAIIAAIAIIVFSVGIYMMLIDMVKEHDFSDRECQVLYHVTRAFFWMLVPLFIATVVVMATTNFAVGFCGMFILMAMANIADLTYKKVR